MLIFFRTHGVRVAGWLYITGTLVMLVGGMFTSSTGLVVSAGLFLAGSAVYAFAGIYWLGCLVRLLGQVVFFTAIPWTAMTAVSAICSFPAMLLGSIEPLIGERRGLTFILSVLSRITLLWVAYRDPWLMATILVLIAGDACLGISKAASYGKNKLP